ncbi:transcription regulator protein BACH2 [Engraulis encrasicolus]|uniref:transcription regulator protein BACH2 n=1 Tax=Engraulis encrasicolus TaxID=184585 RepID=UPI002FD38551
MWSVEDGGRSPDGDGCGDGGLVYVHESPSHGSRLLGRLEAQRREGVLCDVTVKVEGQRVRAHAAVLAACSGYFLQRLLSRDNEEEGDNVITLPSTVTARGFTPLLQFAYTGRLSISKSSLHEVISCAELLHVSDLEGLCLPLLASESDSPDVKDEVVGPVLPLTSLLTLGSGLKSEEEEEDECFSETPDVSSFRPPMSSSLGGCREEEDDEAPFTSDLSQCTKHTQDHADTSVHHGNCSVRVNSDVGEIEKPLTSDLLQSSKHRKQILKQALSDHHGNPTLHYGNTKPVNCSPSPTVLLEQDTFSNGVQKSSPESAAPDDADIGEETPLMSIPLENIKKEEMNKSSSVLLEYKSSDRTSSSNLAADLRSILKVNTRLPLPHISPLLLNSGLTNQHSALHDAQKTQGCPLTSASVKVNPSRSHKPLSRRAVLLQGGEETARTSVIFTSGFPRQPESPEHSSPEPMPCSRSPQNVCRTSDEKTLSPRAFTPPQANTQGSVTECEQSHADRTATTSTNYSSDEDGRNEESDSPSSLPSLATPRLPFPRMAYCLALRQQSQQEQQQQQQQNTRAEEAILKSPGPTQVATTEERSCYDSSSGDESGSGSGSVSAGNCESSPRVIDAGLEVNLPFPVDQLTYLPRTDFQLVMRTQRLTPEQLGFIQDERRRTKNRMAAQRCRKRKLDCIQNLEVDIHKLVCEKETLLRERSQLRACLVDLKESVSHLSHTVHRRDQEEHTEPSLAKFYCLAN